MILKKIIIGNWKMNPLTMKEAEKIFSGISKNLKNKKTEVAICPPFLYLEKLGKISKKVSLGAQNICLENGVGSYTGEVSAEMLINIKAKYVILGHSERRAGVLAPLSGESNQDVNKKIKMALDSSLVPVFCFGENERDENHEYLIFIKKQIEECLEKISKENISRMIIAYEPIWAIGKNAKREATPAEFREMSIYVKKILSDKFGIKINMPRIIYGGSVHPENVQGFLAEGADGFLVGRDSLDVKKFLSIVSSAETNF
ncbi:triose-phosphate isomerase [Candidatus Nomurabacteria bacterium]|nr:triose-phosphate isomerase [Candidatus Nomurabacteria bacterium]